MPADTVFRMPFGKPKGQPISEVPTWYFAWVINFRDMDPRTMHAIQVEYANRPQVSPPRSAAGRYPAARADVDGDVPIFRARVHALAHGPDHWR